MCFHIPRVLWKHSEGGIVKMLVGDLTNPIYMVILELDRHQPHLYGNF